MDDPDNFCADCVLLRVQLGLALADAAEEKERREKSGERAQYYANRLRQTRGRLQQAERRYNNLDPIIECGCGYAGRRSQHKCMPATGGCAKQTREQS